MKNRSYLFVLSALLLFGCSQKREEIDSKKIHPSSDTIAIMSVTTKPNLIPLPEVDSTLDINPRIYLIKGQDGFVLFDSVGLDTFHLSFKRQRIDVGLKSPTGKYIACLVRVSLVDEPGIWGDKPAPKRAYHNLVVVNTVSARIVRRMKPPCDSFMNFDKWVSKSRLLFHTSDGFAVGCYFVFDAFRDSLQRVPDEYDDK
jgi:hypothetical protein